MDCPQCGHSFNAEQQPELARPDPDHDWYQVLVDKSSAIPTRAKCRRWLVSHGISEKRAYDTALEIASKLSYVRRSGRWKGPTSTYGAIWPTFQVWVRRPAWKVNGAKPEQVAADPDLARLRLGEG